MVGFYSRPTNRTKNIYRWWFQTFCIFTPNPGVSIRLAHIFQTGWFNHQLGMIVYLGMFPFPRCKRGISWWKHFWCVNGQEFLPPKQLTKIWEWNFPSKIWTNGIMESLPAWFERLPAWLASGRIQRSMRPKSRWKRNGNIDSAICNAFNTCAVNAVSSLTAPSPHQHQFPAETARLRQGIFDKFGFFSTG